MKRDEMIEILISEITQFVHDVLKDESAHICDRDAVAITLRANFLYRRKVWETKNGEVFDKYHKKMELTVP